MASMSMLVSQSAPSQWSEPFFAVVLEPHRFRRFLSRKNASPSDTGGQNQRSSPVAKIINIKSTSPEFVWSSCANRLSPTVMILLPKHLRNLATPSPTTATGITCLSSGIGHLGSVFCSTNKNTWKQVTRLAVSAAHSSAKQRFPPSAPRDVLTGTRWGINHSIAPRSCELWIPLLRASQF